MHPGALEAVYSKRKGYLHRLSAETFEELKGRPTRWEQVSKKAVTPEDVEEVLDVLEALRKDPDIKLHRYSASARVNRKAVRRQVSRMLELSPGEAAEYKKWRLENAPPEMRQLFNEELRRARSAVREKKAALLEKFARRARHEEARRRERTRLPRRYVAKLRRQVPRLRLPKGTHFAKMPDGSFAVLKDTGSGHVLASFLTKDMHPPGRDMTRKLRSSAPPRVGRSTAPGRH